MRGIDWRGASPGEAAVRPIHGNGRAGREPAFDGTASRVASGQRILLVVPQPFYSDRGSPIAIREVIGGYLDLGHRVDVVTYPIGQDIDQAGVSFYRAGNPLGIRSVPIGFSLRKVALDVTLSLAVRERLRAGSYDFVHALEEAAFPAAYLARRYGVPLIYDMHSRLSNGVRWMSTGPLQWLGRATERWLFRNAGVIVASKGLAQQVRRYEPDAVIFEWQFSGTLGVALSRPDELRAELDVAADVPVVLYCGTFAEYQGIDLLLSSVQEVVRRVPAAMFVLVGTEPAEIEAVNATVASLGIADHVRIVPRQPREKMPSYLAMADVLVSARLFGDNVPLKIFDYMNAGKPIVATDIATHRTLLDETNALLVAPRPEAFGRAVARVLGDSNLAAKLRQAAQAYAHERLGWPAFVAQIGRILDAAQRVSDVNGRRAREWRVL